MKHLSSSSRPASRPRPIGWSLLVGGIVSLGALYLAFRNVPMADLGGYLKTIDYRYLALSLAIVVLILTLKAFRWQVILGATTPVGFGQAFHPMMIGFMLNCVLPGRIGELARPVLLSRRSDVPFATGLSTVVAERILDMLTILALLAWAMSALNLATGPAIEFAGYRIDGGVVVAVGRATAYLALALVSAVCLVRLEAVRRWIKSLIHRLPHLVPGLTENKRQWFVLHLCQPLERLIDQIAAGLTLVGRPLRLMVCILMSATVWLLTAVSFSVMAKGFPGIVLSLPQMTAVLVVISFCIALPSVPGWWGLWEAGGIFALSLLGIGTEQAAGFTLVNHAAQIFPVIVIGVISALATGVRLGRITKTVGRV